jgi:hypothetical protein
MEIALIVGPPDNYPTEQWWVEIGSRNDLEHTFPIGPFKAIFHRPVDFVGVDFPLCISVQDAWWEHHRECLRFISGAFSF